MFLRLKVPSSRSSSSSSSRPSAGSAATWTPSELGVLFPEHPGTETAVPAVVLHNAPGRYRPITDAIASAMDGAARTLDVVNPYVTDRSMIRRMTDAARRGVRVRLFVPANANNWACAAAQQYHHRALLESGVEILGYPTMLHAKAFVRDERGRPPRDVQPRGVEPSALLRDRRPRPVGRARGAVRGALHDACDRRVVSRAGVSAERGSVSERGFFAAISPLL